MMNRKQLHLLLAVFVALLLLLGLIIFRQRTFSAKLTIQVAPAKSLITLNSKKTVAGSLKLRPGPYKITVSYQGFASATRDINLSKNDNQYVGIILGSNSPNTTNWYQTHQTDQRLAEIISGRNFDSIAEAQIQKLPLIKSLPFIDQFYRVDYGKSKAHPSDHTAAAIYITYYSADGKQQALDWIKFKGYDPGSLEIIYVNKSP